MQMVWPIKQRKQKKKKRSLGKRICSIVRVPGLCCTLYIFTTVSCLASVRRSAENEDINNFQVESKFVIFDETVSNTYHGGLKDLKCTTGIVKRVL